MAQLPGHAGGVKSNGAALDAGIDSFTFDYTNDALEASVFGTQAKIFIAGPLGASGTFAGGADGNALTVGNAFASMRFYLDATHFWAVSSLITGVHDSASQGGKVTRTYDFVGTGTTTVPSF